MHFDYEERSAFVDYTYEIDLSELQEVLYDIIDEDEEITEENAQAYFDKYYDYLLDYFKEYARERAEEDFDGDAYEQERYEN